MVILTCFLNYKNGISIYKAASRPTSDHTPHAYTSKVQEKIEIYQINIDVIKLEWYTKSMRGDDMFLSYKKLWKRMIDLDISKTELRNKASISTNAIAKLGKNEPLSLETLSKICLALECDIGDIVEVNEMARKESNL